MPAAGLPNGLAYDEQQHRFLAADSVLSAIYSIGLGCAVHTWSDDDVLAKDGLLGANRVQLHDGHLYVSNLDAGTILEIDIEDAWTAGEITAALNPSSEVVLVDGGERTTALTAADGLSNPTAVLVQNGRIYVPSAAYLNQDTPNLLTATLVAE